MRTTACLLALMMSLALVALTCAADPSPEPPGNPLSELQGTWKARAMLVNGKTREFDIVYTFDRGKATSVSAKARATRKMTVVPDKTRKGLFEMKPEGGTRAVRYFFKIEKGELYLSPVRPGVADPKPDFSGTTAPVLILTRAKK
jgi:hypothetical protein